MNPYDRPLQWLQTHSATKAPPGLVHDFANPSTDGSLSSGTITTVTCLGGLTTTLVALRLYVRIRVTKSPGWDDYTCIAALTGALAQMSVIIFGYTYGLGVHEWNTTYLIMIRLVPTFATLDYLHGLVLFTAKLSICLLFFRLFALKRSLRIAIYFAILYNFFLHVAGTFALIGICPPGDGRSYWSCAYKVSRFHIWRVGFNIPSDFYLLVLPIWAVARLQMPRRRKWALVGVFGTGLLFKQDRSSDLTWNIAPELILEVFELDACIIVGCLPVMPGLARQIHIARLFARPQERIRSYLVASENRAPQPGGSPRWSGFASNSPMTENRGSLPVDRPSSGQYLTVPAPVPVPVRAVSFTRNGRRTSESELWERYLA